MFSSFYNTHSFHSILTETLDDMPDEADTIPILQSVTFKTSIISSPTIKKPIHKVPDLKIHQFSTISLPIILPLGRFHLMWSVMLFFLLAYTLIETPYTVAFVGAVSMYNDVYVVSLCIDAILLFDIAINFRTAYIDKYDKLRVIHEPTLIAKHYLTTWFFIDFLAAFPFSLIALILSGTTKYLILFRILRLIKLIRIIRILQMFKYFHQQAMQQYEARSMLKLSKILCFMLLTAHYCACFWFVIGRYTYDKNMDSWIDSIVEEEDNPQLHLIPNFKLYSFSIYWSIVTLFTTGYGDVHAHNEYEQWTAILCILIGSMFFAYFIGMLSSLLNEDRVHCHEHQKIEEALLFCSHYNLGKELTQAIKTHIQYYQKYNFVFDKKEIMDALPAYLQKSVQTHLAKNLLKGLDIFESLSTSIIGQIALKLKSKSINMGHLLFKYGDIGKELYIQRTGKSSLLSHNNGACVGSLGRGDVCGENVIINRKRSHSVKCETWSEFYSLDIRDIIDVLKNNLDPLTAQKEWENIKQIVRLSTDRTQEMYRPRSSISNPSFDGNGTEGITNTFKQLFKMDSTERSVVRNENIIKNFNQQKSGLEVEYWQYFDDEKVDNDKCCVNFDDELSSEDSVCSGGFGERFGLYRIRKHKKEKVYDDNIPRAPKIKALIPQNINIIYDILGGDQSEHSSNINNCHSDTYI